MKFVRILLLQAISLAGATAWAQSTPFVNLYFYKSVMDSVSGVVRDVSTPYGKLDVASPRTDYYRGPQEDLSEDLLSPGLRMLSGERFRVLVVYSDGALPSDIIPFSIDARGDVVDCKYESGWSKFGTTTGPDVLYVRDIPGIPVELNSDGTPALVTAYATRSLSFLEKATFFLVTLDSRMPNSEGEAWVVSEDAPVARYGVARLAEVGALSMGATDVAVAVGETTAPVSGYTLSAGNPAPVRPTAALTSYVHDGVEYDGDALDALLTPSLQADPNADPGSFTVIPSAVPQLYRYAVETTDTLGGTWELLDEWVARKNIDGTAPLGYSAIVPDGRTPVVLPRLNGEKSRFYRLVAPGK